MNRYFLNKKNVIEFVIIFIVAIILCNGFIRMHYTTDTYKIVDEGYENYAVKWSLKDGRIIMFTALMICDTLNVPIVITNFLFTTIGIIILCICVVLIKDTISEKKNFNLENEIIILFVSFTLIFNFMCIETIYFLEIFIISLSLLFYIIATRLILKEDNKKLPYIFLFVLMGIISYQGTLSFFIVFSISMSIIYNSDMKLLKLIKVVIKIIIVSAIAVGIDMILVKYIGKHIGISQNRLHIDKIITNIIHIKNNFHLVLIYSCGILKKYCYLCILIICLLFSAMYIFIKKDKILRHYFNLLFITLLSIVTCFLPFIITLSSFGCGRMYIALGTLPSLILMYLIANTNILNSEKKIYINIFITVIGSIFAIYSITYLVRIEESRMKNKLEKIYCEEIINYFKEKEIEIKQGAICPVVYNENMVYFKEINTKNAMTVNEIRGYESAISGLNVTTENDIEEVKLTESLKEKYLEKINNGETGINNTYAMYIDDILIMPAFVW